MRRLLVSALALLLAGCTATQAGTPVAGDDPAKTSTSSTTTTTTTTTETTADRPRNIDVAAIDVCQLVSGLPLATFGLDADRPPLPGESGTFPGAKQCFANGVEKNLSLLIVAVVDQGVADYVDGANADVDDVDADGFPLAILSTPASPDSCFGALDVNDGQMLFINYGLSAPGSEPATPQATLCQRIPDIARAALAGL